MSQASATEPTSTKSGQAINPQTEPADPELRALDERLKRVSEKYIQTTPYILTVPSERPYRPDKRFAHEWRKNTSFDIDEEQLQHLSFLPDWDQGLITPLGAWDNDKGAMDTQSHSGRSAAGTPSVGAKKVKLSLSDYKKKTAGGQQGGSVVPKENDARKSTNGVTTAEDKSKATLPSSQGQKRSRDEVQSTDKSKEDKLAKDASASKKRRPSPSPSLPRRREFEKELSPLDFPPELSPTLPPQILAELEKLGKLAELGNTEKKEKVKSTVAHDNVKARPETHKSETAPKANGVVKAQPATQKNAERPRASTTTSSSSLITKPSEKLVIKKTSEAAQPAPPRKLVKLKITKSIRGRYNQLMKLAPTRPKSEASKAPKRETIAKSIEREGGKSLAKPSTATPEPPKKRLRPDDDAPPPAAKRPRAPSNVELSPKPSTPASFKSPSMSHHGSSQKPKGSTPSLEHRNAPSRGEEVATPVGATRNGSTPVAPDSVERPSKNGRSAPTSSGLSARNSDEIGAYQKLQADYFQLGRKLKHEHRDMFPPNETPSSQLRKKNLAVGIESVLCFMASYAVRQERNRLLRSQNKDKDKTWVTLYPFLGQVKSQSTGHPYLRGLCTLLEAVCQTQAFNLECENAAQATSDQPPLSTKDLITQHRLASSLFVEGATDLSVDDLQHTFPNSWRHKAGVPLAKIGKKFEAKIDGEFYLPLTNITTALEAVRAGRSILAEWCRMERVDWTARLGKEAEKSGPKGGIKVEKKPDHR